MSIREKTTRFVKENKRTIIVVAGVVTVIVLAKKGVKVKGVKRAAAKSLRLEAIPNEFPLDMSITEIKDILMRREGLRILDAIVTTHPTDGFKLYLREVVK